jgi:beta-phosphoglucomutase-like phosphatase (HAD superfamily)
LPSECVVVGDAPVDIQAGKAAGTLTVAAVYGYGDLRLLRKAGPHGEIQQFSELPSVLEKLEQSAASAG